MEVVNHEEMIVSGLLVHAPLRHLRIEVPKAWRQLFDRASELEEIRIAPFMDICIGVADSMYLQLVGFQVGEETPIPKGLTTVHIPAQELLHHRHVGPVTSIANTFGDMYSWGEQNGLMLGEFKLDQGYTPAGGETEHDLYVGLWPEVACSHFDDLTIYSYSTKDDN
ncbi:MAG: GyrI-like domain-containing protein [Gammaproteobacteria bacterium]